MFFLLVVLVFDFRGDGIWSSYLFEVIIKTSIISALISRPEVSSQSLRVQKRFSEYHMSKLIVYCQAFTLALLSKLTLLILIILLDRFNS